MEKERKNLVQLTEEVCKVSETSVDDVVSSALVYRHKNDNPNKKKPFTIKGINVQFYGHMLIIVPDVRNMSEYFVYHTAEQNARRAIADDLINIKKFSQEDAAKLMKCSKGAIVRLLGVEDNK